MTPKHASGLAGRLRLRHGVPVLVILFAVAPLPFVQFPALSAQHLPAPSAHSRAPGGALSASAVAAGERKRAPATIDVAKPSAAPTPTVTITPSSALVSAAYQGIPKVALQAYVSAATLEDTVDPHCSISWSLLAGIGRVESDHAASGGSGNPGWDGIADPPIYGPALDGSGGSPAMPNTDPAIDGSGRWTRAVGPMQFLPSSWLEYGADADGDGIANPQDIRDAAYTAARYLCAGGADLADPAQASAAVYAYNHASWYVSEVLAYAQGYATNTAPAAVASPGTVANFVGVRAPALAGVPKRPALPSSPAELAVAFAYSKLGTPYKWGGTGPEFDCSGLVQAAYASAGVALARTSEQQWLTVPPVVGALRAGDLVFFNPGEFQSGLPGHVGLYIGNGFMIDAPHTGAVVRIEPVAGFGQYMGAARPSGLLPSPTSRPGASPSPSKTQANSPSPVVQTPVSAPSPTGSPVTAVSGTPSSSASASASASGSGSPSDSGSPLNSGTPTDSGSPAGSSSPVSSGSPVDSTSPSAATG